MEGREENWDSNRTITGNRRMKRQETKRRNGKVGGSNRFHLVYKNVFFQHSNRAHVLGSVFFSGSDYFISHLSLSEMTPWTVGESVLQTSHRKQVPSPSGPTRPLICPRKDPLSSSGHGEAMQAGAKCRGLGREHTKLLDAPGGRNGACSD
jgi:hypothetical protein